MSLKDAKPALLLRIATLKGVIYEEYVSYLQIKKRDGVMVINKNYAPALEQLCDGEIIVYIKNQKVVISASNGWLTVKDNKCHIYSSDAEIVTT